MTLRDARSLRPLADIRSSGAAWITESELAWLCDAAQSFLLWALKADLAKRRAEAAEARAVRAEEALRQIAALPHGPKGRAGLDRADSIAREALAAAGADTG